MNSHHALLFAITCSGALACAPVIAVDQNAGTLSVEITTEGLPIEPGEGYQSPEFHHNPEFLGSQAFLDLKADHEYMCAIRLDGTILCEGNDGNLGRTHPPPGAFVEVELSQTGACARRADMTWACWGFKEGSESWLPGSTKWPTSTIQGLSIGALGACALSNTGAPICWGEEDWADLPPGPYSQVEVNNSGQSFCAIRSDTFAVECQRMDGSVPTDYQPSGTFDELSWEGDVLAGVRTDGSISSSGHNRNMILMPEPAGTNFQSIQVHRSAAYALTDTGAIEVFPEVDGEGAAFFEVPTWNYIQVAAMSGGFCARADTGRVVCAGWMDWIPALPAGGDTGGNP